MKLLFHSEAVTSNRPFKFYYIKSLQFNGIQRIKILQEKYLILVQDSKPTNPAHVSPTRGTLCTTRGTAQKHVVPLRNVEASSVIVMLRSF